MNKAVRLLGIGFALSILLAAPAAALINVDGTLDGAYGSPASTQAIQTNFGDNSDGAIDLANGSELDLGYAVRINDHLHIFLAGNLESNFNKLEIFLDVHSGGQNQLRGDNSGVDSGGLNRMGDDGGGNGLKFDSGFEADYWIGVTGGGGPYALYANYAVLLTGGGGAGDYLGTTSAGSDGTLTGGTNHGIQVTINNSNTGGVSGGCAADGGAAGTTGIEIMIPYSELGGTLVDNVKICAFVNGGGHDYVSNQVLGPLPDGTCNLAEPRNVDFSGIAGDQFFTSTALGPSVPVSNGLLIALAALLLAGASVLVLRRRATA